MKNDILPSKIKKVLKAAANTPYYDKLFKKYNIDIENINTFDDFTNIPITTKNVYKNNTFDFISNTISKDMDKDYLKSISGDYKKIDDYLEKFGLNLVITSGSTGIPLEVIHSEKDDIRNYFALNTYRKKFFNFNIASKYLWILPMNKKTQCMFYDKDLSFINNGDLGIHYFLVNYTDENISRMHKTIVSNSIRWITGSPTAITEYAKFMLKNNLSYPFDYIELHSEPCLEWQEELIQTAFGITPSKIYSSNEINFMAATCNHNEYHILKDNVYIELIDKKFGDLHYKKVIVTGLNYFDTPFIRYDIGDLAESINCVSCNMKHDPSISLKGFRDSDMIMCKSGELIEPYIIYDSIFFLEKELNFEIGYYQVVQNSYTEFLFKFERFYDWDNTIKIIIKDYITKFISEALDFEVDILITSYNLNSSYDYKSKYVRFKSCCINKDTIKI